MCSREKDEPLLRYWFRQFKEEPLRVLIVLCMGALVYMYNEGQCRQEDYRADMKEQNSALIGQMQVSTQVMAEMKTQLELLNSRVGHLEREHEMSRKAASNEG